ncbi:MAG TPA: protease SohB, partial [Pseudomonas sp.]
MEFLVEYAGFLARTATVLAAILVVLVAIAVMRHRERRAGGHLEVHKLNDFYKSLRDRLQDG